MGNILEGFQEVLIVLAVLILTWVAFRFKKSFFRKIEKKRTSGKKTLDVFTVQVIGKIFSIFVFFLALMIILKTFGVDILPLLTFSGIGAAILGFASKDVISNFFGGSMIYITRPFALNDYIEIPGKQVAGVVEEIGWYLTTIRNLQKKCIYLPNSLFSTELLLNYSRMTHRRIEEQLRFRITESGRADAIIIQAKEFISKHPDIDHSEQIDVYLHSISPYGVVIDIRAYTKTTKYLKFMEIRQDVLLNVYRIAAESD